MNKKKELTLPSDLVADIFSMISSYLDINIFAVKPNGEYLFRNEKLKNIMGDINRMEEIDTHAWESCKTVMQTKKAISVEECHDNTWYLSVKSPFYKNGIVEGVIGIAVDITDRKEAEQLRLEIKAVEERSQTIKLIAASMAHELKTPLQGISSGTDGITRQLPCLIEGYKMAEAANMEVPYLFDEDIKRIPKVLDNIKFEAKSAFSVVDMFLVKAGLAPIKKEAFTECSIKKCVDEALRRYPFTEENRKLVHWKEEDFEFKGDEMLMVHVLFNLFKNALYYIKSARKGIITMQVQKSKDHNILIFKDTGQGIPPDILPHIFEHFYSQTPYGTGVGLAFCKMVMESLGGRIECNSQEGEYTEFMLYFPTQYH